MCWSVLLLPEGGVPAPHQCPPGHAIDQFLGERAPEQEDQVASRLGFHVERRELAGGMECIQVWYELGVAYFPTGVIVAPGARSLRQALQGL